MSAVRRASDPRVAAFANAVLRKLAAERGKLGIEAATLAATPGWLRAAVGRAVGSDADAFFTAGPIPPPIALCLRAGEEREEWLRKLGAAGADVEPGRLSPRAVLVRGADPRRLPGAGERWVVQEEGAQAVGLLAAPRDAERVLDACAGRGTKAILLAELAQRVVVDAADLHPSKLEALRAMPGGAAVAATHAVDWTRGSGDVPSGYDRALVDAPCTGTGTLRRRPEITARLVESDVARLASVQRAIVEEVATRVRPGGRLVYAVCSVLREEAEGVVAGLSHLLEPAPFDSELGRALAGEAPSVRLLPHAHGTDGYFVASFVRR